MPKESQEDDKWGKGERESATEGKIRSFQRMVSEKAVSRCSCKAYLWLVE